jgi:hypothetical protein
MILNCSIQGLKYSIQGLQLGMERFNRSLKND